MVIPNPTPLSFAPELKVLVALLADTQVQISALWVLGLQPASRRASRGAYQHLMWPSPMK